MDVEINKSTNFKKNASKHLTLFMLIFISILRDLQKGGNYVRCLIGNERENASRANVVC
jgi:hypothetical protein